MSVMTRKASSKLAMRDSRGFAAVGCYLCFLWVELFAGLDFVVVWLLLVEWLLLCERLPAE